MEQNLWKKRIDSFKRCFKSKTLFNKPMEHKDKLNQLEETLKERTAIHKQTKLEAKKAKSAVEGLEGEELADAQKFAELKESHIKVTEEKLQIVKDDIKVVKAKIRREKSNAGSVPITEEFCKEHRVPIYAKGSSEVFVHEYCRVLHTDSEGKLKTLRKIICRELVEIGISKSTAQRQVSRFIVNSHPKAYRGYGQK